MNASVEALAVGDALVLSKETYVLSMSAAAAPAIHASLGTPICFECADCFADQIATMQDVDKGIDWGTINPATGPVYIDGTSPGDVLVAHIKRIVVSDHGVMFTGGGWGVLGDIIDRVNWRMLHIAGNEAKWDGGPSIAVRPMVGVIGVAPDGNEIPCGTPGHHGGNMDTTLITEGSLVYLPVRVPGALLSVGDLHAAMGDGEVGISGIEVSGVVLIETSLRTDLRLSDPVVENGNVVATVASAETLDEAARMAVENMAVLCNRRFGIGLSDAMILMSAVGNLRISQVVDPLRTVRFEMPKTSYERRYGPLI